MRLIINGACIKDKKVLLLRKKKSWIFPGGKPDKGESDSECLFRECSKEELPGIQTKIEKLFGEFTGKTPHKGDIAKARVYFVDMEGDFAPAAEISESGFFTHFDCVNSNLSDISRKIVDELKKSGYIK